MRSLLFVFLVVVCASSVHSYEWVVVPWQEVPLAQPDDVVDVYFMISPLMKQVYGDIFGFINLTHAAVGVVNRNSNTSFTINYEAVNTVLKVFVPQFVPSQNSSFKNDLVWQNQGAAFIYEGIYVEYWNKGYDLICSINGTEFNKFISSYVATVNQTQPWYNMLDVWVGGWEQQQHSLNSYTCFDFAFQAFQVLQGYGVNFIKDVSKRNYINLFVNSEPRKVDINDPATRGRVVAFYSLFQKKIVDVAALVLDVVFGGKIYLHVDEDTYYEVTAASPYLGWKYIDSPLVSSKDNTTSAVELQIFDLVKFWGQHSDEINSHSIKA